MSTRVHYYPRPGSLPVTSENDSLYLGPSWESPRIAQGFLTGGEFAHYLRQLATEATRLAAQLDANAELDPVRVAR